MPTRVTVDMPICGYKAIIRAEKVGGSVKVEIESDCEHVKQFADALSEVGMRDVMHISNNKIMEVAGNYLTPSCLIPCAIMNAARLEFGLISKSLAMKKGDLRIVFEE
ncbi:hypothetical protein DRN98_08570 [Methanosarcinales archaeon]|nr:MAG: hypothetical protein DRN98_08570 [Methanosarcinales archaeon]